MERFLLYLRHFTLHFSHPLRIGHSPRLLTCWSKQIRGRRLHSGPRCDGMANPFRKGNSMRHLLAITGMLIFGSAVSAADPATPVFTQKPSTTRVGEGVKITFAVSAPTDVEVAILGGDGKIVRHLVAGALGKNPPEPLKPDSLAQEVVWDQKDDDGKPVAGGGCKARVRLGMKPEPDGFLLDNPDHLGPVRAMATDGKGRLVVLQSNPLNLVWWHGIGIKVFNHAGHYEKTLMPFPASLPNERLGDCKPMRTETGELVPRIFNAFLRCFYPDPSPTYAGGYYLYHSIAVDAKGRVFFPVFGPRLASVDADGGLPYPEFLGPTLLPEVKGLNSANRWGFGKDNIRLTVSSDNKWIYMGGLTTDPKTPKAIPCVYRLDIEKRGSAEKFVGDPDKPGTEKELLSSPCGMAVAKGILYIADKAAGRVAPLSGRSGWPIPIRSRWIQPPARSTC